MKLETKNIISAKNIRHLGNTIGAKNSNPLKKHNDISFRGFDFTKTVDKLTGQITYSNMSKVAPKIDNILGDKYFSTAINKAGLQIENDKLQLQDASLIKDIWRTVKYPFVDLWLDIPNAIAKGLKKVNFLKPIGEKLESIPILKKRAGAAEIEKNLEFVNDILENFANEGSFGRKVSDGNLKVFEFDSSACAKKLDSNTALKLVKSSKNYNSRDERTLNRIATSTVSALYGAADFHNISMLQKDDEAQAKKAGKGRFRQEMYRMCLNAGTTFLMMGALNKYIKHSMPLSIITIGASAFLAEVVSRILSKTPLKRLSPEEAREIALKKHPELAEASKDSNNKQDDKVNFTQKIDDTNKIFVQFQSKDGHSPALTCMKNRANEAEAQKKKTPLHKIILSAVGIASAAYLVSSLLKGKFFYKHHLKKLYDFNTLKVSKYLENPDSMLDAHLENKLADITETYQKRDGMFSIFRKFKKAVTNKNVMIDLEELSEKVTDVGKTATGKEIDGTIQKYNDIILEKMLQTKPDENGKILMKAKEERILAKGLYDGFSKLFNTIYKILSAPAMILETVLDHTVYKKANKLANIYGNRKLDVSLEENIQKLHTILKRAKVFKPEGKIYQLTKWLPGGGYHPTKALNNAANEIVNNTRNFAEGPATGDLANFSRTLVTAIATLFFVNDYTNRVLIESAGKDVQKANEEKKQRYIHKASNFVFNGTLMNLFNSVFVKTLNRSLVGATLVASATEVTNEFLVRKSICQPVTPMGSRQEIIDYEEKQLAKKGLAGAWSRFYKKITGKKSLTQKTNS